VPIAQWKNTQLIILILGGLNPITSTGRELLALGERK
jgi:hypothetical protein